jgi:hypothetical protein
MIGFIFMLMHDNLDFPLVYLYYIVVSGRTTTNHRCSSVTAMGAFLSREISNFFSSSNCLLISSSKACFSRNFSSSSLFRRTCLSSISNCVSIFLHPSLCRHSTFLLGFPERSGTAEEGKERRRKTSSCFRPRRAPLKNSFADLFSTSNSKRLILCL